MPLSIKDAETDRLARKVAAATGESLTAAVREALRERLRRLEGRAAAPRLSQQLRDIRMRCSRLPVLDDRRPDEILGYDTAGLPHGWS
jgi:antitoxin VapB